jgi:Flp pilus assembly protein TadG
MRYGARRQVRSGATMVETVFVLTIFLMLLFGIFEYGRFVMTKQIMENAAREGARYAVVNTNDATTADVQNFVDQKLTSAKQQLSPYVKTTNITIFAADANGNPIGGTNWNDVKFAQNIAVQVSGTYTPLLPNLLRMNSSITITAKSVMASEGN